MTDKIWGKKNSEPFLRIARRDDIGKRKAWLIRIAALVFSLLLCGIFVYIVKRANPLELYRDMFMGTFRSEKKIMATLMYIAPLLCVGIALAPAFKMRFWNIGGEGQVLIGAFAATFFAVRYNSVMSAPVLLIVMFLAAIVAGAVWITRSSRLLGHERDAFHTDDELYRAHCASCGGNLAREEYR